MAAELRTLAEDADCSMHRQWFEHGPAALQTGYVLERLERKLYTHCASPDWNWLMNDPSAEAVDLRGRYLALLSDAQLGAAHEYILSGLTSNGSACFDRKVRTASAALQEICAKWISEPQEVRRKLRHGGLQLTRAQRFHAASLGAPAQVIEQQGDWPETLRQWLVSAIQKAQPDVRQEDVEAFAASLRERKLAITSATHWTHQRKHTALIALDLNAQEEGGFAAQLPSWPFQTSRVLLLVAPRSLKSIGIPGRFAYQYDEGSIANVSDLDDDGNPEVWFNGTFGECDGEDLRPGIDCAVETAHMGEVFGDALSYFVDDRRDGARAKQR